MARDSAVDNSPSLSQGRQPGGSEQEARLGGEAARRHMADLLAHPDEQTRERAVFALAEVGDLRAVDGLLALLADAHNPVLLRAVYACAALPDERLFEPLIHIMFTNHIRTLRDSAAVTLSRLGCEQALAACCEALSGEDVQRRLRAVEGLRRFETPARIPLLRGALDDEDGMVRIAAVQALGKVEGPAVAGWLTPVLRDEDAAVREAAVNQLGRIADPATEYLLLDLLNDPVHDVRRAAVSALGGLGGDRVVERLRLLLTSDPDRGIRYVTVMALQRTGDIRAVVTILSALRSDPYARVRATAAMALGSSPLEHAVEGAVTSPSSPGFNLLWAQAPDLSDVVIRTLKDALLEDPEPQVRAAAADTLGKCGRRYASLACMIFPALHEAMIYDRVPVVRLHAVQAMTGFAVPAVVDALITALYDGHAIVQRAAADALGKMKAVEAVPALLASLRDMGPQPDHLPAVSLLRRLTEPVGVHAARALVRIGTEEALEAVAAWRLDHPEYPVS